MTDLRSAVPADLELEDRLAGLVTFRMAAWLAVAAAGVVLVATGGGGLWRLPVASLLITVGLVGALLRVHGRPVTSLLLPALAYRRRVRTERQGRSAEEQTEPNVAPGHSRWGSAALAARSVRHQPPRDSLLERGTAVPPRFIPPREDPQHQALPRRWVVSAVALSLLAVGAWSGRQAATLFAPDARRPAVSIPADASAESSPPAARPPAPGTRTPLAPAVPPAEEHPHHELWEWPCVC